MGDITEFYGFKPYVGANKDCKVVTSYGILQKIHKNKHRLSAETLKQIPKKMSDPVAVFESATVDGRYVMMIDLVDDNGATIVVPIEFSKSGRTVNIRLHL